MKQIEYETKRIRELQEVQPLLNEMEKQGWELISITEEGDKSYAFYFKRENYARVCFVCNKPT